MKAFALRHFLVGLGMAVSASALLAPVRADAFELFGIKLFGKDAQEKNEDVVGEPQAYSVEFVVTGQEHDVEKALKGASMLWTDRKKPASGAAGLLAKARTDYQRLLATLYGLGRYGGTISILVAGREAAGLPPDAELPDPAAVTVTVNPGPVFLFDKASIINQAPPPTQRRDRVPLPADEGYAPGGVARSGEILQAEQLSVEAWRQQGHPKARVARRTVTADHDTDRVEAEIDIDPERYATYGPVTVQGTDRMDPAFVAWMTGLKPGQEYDPDDIKRANDRLSRLDVFRALRIQEADQIRPDGRLPLTVVVQERQLHRFGIGAGFSTLDGAQFETYWLHRNLFGHAERLRFDAKIAGLGGDSFSANDLTYRVGVTFTRPGIYTPDTDFVATLFGEREVLDTYTKKGISGGLGFNHMFSQELSGRLFANGEYAEFEDDVFGTRDFTTAGLLGGLLWDNRNSKVDPTTGYFAEAVAEPFYEFNYGNTDGRFTLEGRTYLGLGEKDPVVLAGRVKVGTLFGSTIPETPPDKLFFAGGGGSVRGYAYRSIGVDLGGDEVVGGRSLLEGSAELRVRVSPSIGVVAFVDAGYVDPEFVAELQWRRQDRRRRRLALLYRTGADPPRPRGAARAPGK